MLCGFSEYQKKVMRKISSLRGQHAEGGEFGPEFSGDFAETPIHEAKYVVFDTELTGLNVKKDSIVSIGALRMQGGRIEVGEMFYRLVEPETELTGKSVVIHGITPSEAAGCPAIDVLLPEFLGFCRGSVLVGHVVSIDLAFLNNEVRRLCDRQLQNPALDTFKVYRWVSGRQTDSCAYFGGSPEGTDLFSLAKKYRIPVNGAHNALSDAFVTAQLFQRFLSVLPELGVKTIGDLLRIGKP